MTPRVPAHLLREGHIRSVRHPLESVRWLWHTIGRVRRTDGADRLYREVTGSWDRAAFIDRFRSYWDPFPTLRPAKYLDLGSAVRDAAHVYLASKAFADGRRKRVLDIGCGPGYYLAVCRSQGHEVLGIDLDDQPLYNEMVDFLEIPRIVHRVTPAAPLPDLEGTFDVVSAYGVVFNFDPAPARTSWSAEAWIGALDRFVSILAPGGTLIIGFNADSRTGQLYPPGLRSLLKERSGIHASFVGEQLQIRRIQP